MRRYHSVLRSRGRAAGSLANDVSQTLVNNTAGIIDELLHQFITSGNIVDQASAHASSVGAAIWIIVLSCPVQYRLLARVVSSS